MPKKSNMYLDLDPFKIIETSFHPDRAKVSESIFSLANEYSGIRGYFDEGYSGERLQGSYFNGIYEYALSDTPNAYKGIIKRTHFTINSVNWVKCKLEVDGEVLDLNVSKFENFKRVLDLKSGLYTREFVWRSKKGDIHIKFERLMNMEYCHECLQQISLTSSIDLDINISFSLDNNVLHWGNHCYWEKDRIYQEKDIYGLCIGVKNKTSDNVKVVGIEVLNRNYKTSETEIKEIDYIPDFTDEVSDILGYEYNYFEIKEVDSLSIYIDGNEQKILFIPLKKVGNFSSNIFGIMIEVETDGVKKNIYY